MSIINKNGLQKGLFMAVTVAAIFQACLKDVSIMPLPYDKKFSIQCLITPGVLPKAYVYSTVSFFDKKVLPAELFVKNAVVVLSNPDGSQSLLPDSSWNPVVCHMEYFYKGRVAIEPGKRYTLKIGIGAENFTATAATDRRVVQLDSVTYTAAFKDLYGEHEGIQLHFKDPAGKGDFYRFEMGRTFEPTDTIFGVGKVISDCSLGKTTWVQEIGRSIYPDNDADGSVFTLTIEPTFKHKKGKIGYVRLQSMDAATHSFYDQFDRQKLAQFNPFVEPVFIVSGQFGERAFGFFGAFAVSDSMAIVYPE